MGRFVQMNSFILCNSKGNQDDHGRYHMSLTEYAVHNTVNFMSATFPTDFTTDWL